MDIKKIIEKVSSMDIDERTIKNHIIDRDIAPTIMWSVGYLCFGKRLIEEIENLTKHNNDFKKDCSNCTENRICDKKEKYQGGCEEFKVLYV